jgi:GNAT superfamily N-acetyltransferase
MLEIFTGNSPYLKQTETLYLHSFPDNERKPFEMILSNIEKGLIKAWIDVQDEKVCALAFVITGHVYDLLDYLAVSPECQCQGIGSRVLKELDALLNKPLIVEIESTSADPDPLKRRRKKFYENNAFLLSKDEILLFGVQMELMSTRVRISYQQYTEVLHAYFEKQNFNPDHYIQLLDSQKKTQQRTMCIPGYEEQNRTEE